MITSKTLKTLEYDKILNQLSSFAYSKPAKDYILSLKPQTNYDKVVKSLDFTSEADYILNVLAMNISFSFDDIVIPLEKAEKGSILTPGELIKIARVLKVSKNVKKNIQLVPEGKCDNLNNLAQRLYINESLDSRIDSSILSDTEISSNASSRLKSIRDSIVNCNKKIREKLNSYINSKDTQNYLQDNLITIRNNRFVLPIKTEFKNVFKGLIHDQSSSGQTTYIEPIAIVEMNNELRSYQIEEEQEIENILRNFSIEISQNYESIALTYTILVEMDSIFAKARFAKDTKSNRPILNKNGYINLISARHPLIEKEKVVPVSIYVGKEFSTLLISGPNTGGKTVSLKLVGILTLMTLSGMFIPAKENSEVSIFNTILCDIGDSQSIEESLSTFSSHLMTLIDITKNVDDNSLVLLDELGSGTDPVEGAALAIAIINYLMDYGAKTIVTSHYKELKEFAYTANNINIAGMDFDPTTFKPTYKLIMGQTSMSNALEIAQVLGLDDSIVSNAKSLISNEDNEFNNIIKNAEIARREAEELKEKTNLLYKKAQEEELLYQEKLIDIDKKTEKLNEKLSKASKELLSDFIDEADELIDEIKEKVKEGNEKALFEARSLKRKLELKAIDHEEKVYYTKLDGEIKKGDSVFVKSLNKVATVTNISPQKKEISIKVGFIESRVKLKDVEKVKIDYIQPKNEKKTTQSIQYDMSLNISTELNILGKQCVEGVLEMEDYLDQAKAKGYKTVRIVHGKGTGALRNAVHEALKVNKNVESFRLGQYGEGDNGVTIVTLK